MSLPERGERSLLMRIRKPHRCMSETAVRASKRCPACTYLHPMRMKPPYTFMIRMGTSNTKNMDVRCEFYGD